MPGHLGVWVPGCPGGGGSLEPLSMNDDVDTGGFKAKLDSNLHISVNSSPLRISEKEERGNHCQTTSAFKWEVPRGRAVAVLQVAVCCEFCMSVVVFPQILIFDTHQNSGISTIFWQVIQATRDKFCANRQNRQNKRACVPGHTVKLLHQQEGGDVVRGGHQVGHHLHRRTGLGVLCTRQPRVACQLH